MKIATLFLAFALANASSMAKCQFDNGNYLTANPNKDLVLNVTIVYRSPVGVNEYIEPSDDKLQ
jgi:hypothetical protein